MDDKRFRALTAAAAAVLIAAAAAVAWFIRELVALLDRIGLLDVMIGR